MLGSVKKEYRTLGDEPVIVHAIRPFILSHFFSYIVIVVPPPDIEKVKCLIKPYIDPTELKIIGGGKTRQESVFLALKECEKAKLDFVLIHDGARPWIDINLIETVLDKTTKYGACIPVIEVTDALKEIDDDGFIKHGLSRKKIKGAQTPQGFSFNKILKAHKYAESKGYSALDDADVYSLLYKPTMAVKGNVKNKKITYKYDL